MRPRRLCSLGEAKQLLPTAAPQATAFPPTCRCLCRTSRSPGLSWPRAALPSTRPPRGDRCLRQAYAAQPLLDIGARPCKQPLSETCSHRPRQAGYDAPRWASRKAGRAAPAAAGAPLVGQRGDSLFRVASGARTERSVQNVLAVVGGQPAAACRSSGQLFCSVTERAVLKAQMSFADRRCMAFCVGVQCNAPAGHVRQACVRAATRHVVWL